MGAGHSWTLLVLVCTIDCYLVLNKICIICPSVVDCGGPLTIDNGAVDTSSGTTFMMTATYTCNTGYTLIGDTTRTCAADGEWSPIAPVCNRKCYNRFP